MNLPAIIALWYEPGTIYDVRNSLYHKSARRKWVSIRYIREVWAKAQDDGDLPPFDRPANGFSEKQSIVLKRFMMVEREKRAA